jgi:hypothetical protein
MYRIVSLNRFDKPRIAERGREKLIAGVYQWRYACVDATLSRPSSGGSVFQLPVRFTYRVFEVNLGSGGATICGSVSRVDCGMSLMQATTYYSDYSAANPTQVVAPVLSTKQENIFNDITWQYYVAWVTCLGLAAVLFLLHVAATPLRQYCLQESTAWPGHTPNLVPLQRCAVSVTVQLSDHSQLSTFLAFLGTCWRSIS